MKTKMKLAAILLFVAAGATIALTNSRETRADSATEMSASSSPRTLYAQNCARCHGGNGKGDTVLGKKLDADDISGGVSTSKIIRTVTNGKGHMPSFKTRLTQAQIASIAGYVHSM